jgi:hypothetical protein
MSTNNATQLTNRIKGPNNNSMLQAVEELRAKGWLTNGALERASLRRVFLQNANLQGANLRNSTLSQADLQGTNLSLANLQFARLRRADLRGADMDKTNLHLADLFEANLYRARHLTAAQLAQARRLQGVIMPDGDCYDGRFNLIGDIAFAKAGGVNINNPQAMADFYGVPLEEYQCGQNWEQHHTTVVQIPESEYEEDTINTNTYQHVSIMDNTKRAFRGQPSIS